MRVRRSRLVTASVLVVAAVGSVTACSDGSDPEPTAVPTDLPAAAATSPPGTVRVTCDLPVDAGTVRFALDLPEGFQARRVQRHRSYDSVDCAWRSGPTWVGVGYVHADDERPRLDDVYDDESVNAVEGDTAEGDDSILRLELEQDVPVYGTTPGDRLSYLCFCDGQNNIARYAQAAGVRVQWTSVLELEEVTDEQLATALAGAGSMTP